jgi:hypothetical protein
MGSPSILKKADTAPKTRLPHANKINTKGGLRSRRDSGVNRFIQNPALITSRIAF